MKKQKAQIGNTVTVRFQLNGKKAEMNIPSSMMLIDLIREQIGLKGTKPGCLEGECGACSVLINGSAVNSCMYPAVNIEGKKLETIEGLSNHSGLDPVQEALVKHGAVQCGFCTSGMAITIKSMQNKAVGKNLKYSRADVQKGLEGNLCRCTGYVKIIDAAEDVLTKH